jgi:hypothetical protein
VALEVEYLETHHVPESRSIEADDVGEVLGSDRNRSSP